MKNLKNGSHSTGTKNCPFYKEYEEYAGYEYDGQPVFDKKGKCNLAKFMDMIWGCLYNDGKIHRNCPRCKGMLDD